VRVLPHPLPRIRHLDLGAMGGDHAREDGRDRPPRWASGVRGLRQRAAPDRALDSDGEERTMGKPKSTKKAAAKTPKPVKQVAEVIAHEASEEKAPREDLCVFAFRLTAEERDAIHKAAGPAKASRFVRTLVVAAARNDEAAVRAIMKGVQTEA